MKKKRDARVKAMEPNHMKASLRKATLVLQHVVEVLKMKKGRHPISIRARTIDDQGCERERERGVL